MVEQHHFAGTPLSGALAAKTGDISSQDAFTVTVTFYALAKMPPAAFDPLFPRVNLIVTGREDTPVVPSPRLVPGVRFIDSDEAAGIAAEVQAGKWDPSALIGTEEGVLISGTTAAFRLVGSSGIDEQFPGQLKRQAVEVEIYRPKAAGIEKLQPALGISDFVPVAAPGEFDEAFAAQETRSSYSHGAHVVAKAPVRPPLPAPVFQSELALFNLAESASGPGTQGQDVTSGREAFGLIVPIHLGDTDSHALLAVVQISPGASDPSLAQDVKRASDEIDAASAAALVISDSIGVDPPDWPGLSGAVESLAFAGRQRAGLAYMAVQTGAHTTEDVVLSADDAVVSRLAPQVSKAIAAEPPAQRDHKSIGWVLERTTYQLLIALQSSGKFPPELQAVLSIHTGQAGRDAGTLQEVLANARGQQDMQNRLAAENYIFLEDSSPAARVRAFDWLTTQKLAPPGYHPLDPVRDRRDALEKAEQATQPAAP